MSTMNRMNVPMAAGALLAAPRHMWLAALGAAAVTRDWAERDAAKVFRTLVSEGSAIESRALRIVGRRIEVSVERASELSRLARRGAASARSLAGAASTFVRDKLPTLRATVAVEPAKRPARKSAATAAKRGKRTPGTVSTRRSTRSAAKK
jgi:hypothetical protein